MLGVAFLESRLGHGATWRVSTGTTRERRGMSDGRPSTLQTNRALPPDALGGREMALDRGPFLASPPSLLSLLSPSPSPSVIFTGPPPQKLSIDNSRVHSFTRVLSLSQSFFLRTHCSIHTSHTLLARPTRRPNDSLILYQHLCDLSDSFESRYLPTSTCATLPLWCCAPSLLARPQPTASAMLASTLVVLPRE